MAMSSLFCGLIAVFLALFARANGRLEMSNRARNKRAAAAELPPSPQCGITWHQYVGNELSEGIFAAT